MIVYLSSTVLASAYGLQGYCPVSKSHDNKHQPQSFETSNNLLKKPGQDISYCGEKIVVFGRVLDKKCKPVSNAKINIWQVNCKGKYPYELSNKNFDSEIMQIDNENSFTGNGTTISDEDGNFAFITIYPKGAHGLRPHINIIAEHEIAGSLQTMLLLKNNMATNMSLQEIAREEEGANAYYFEIALPNSN